jgi:hypothetical protein
MVRQLPTPKNGGSADTQQDKQNRNSDVPTRRLGPMNAQFAPWLTVDHAPPAIFAESTPTTCAKGDCISRRMISASVGH